MADVPSTWPDNYVELLDQQTPSHIEQKVGPEYGKLSFEIWGVVFDCKELVIKVLSWCNDNTIKNESLAGRDELKQEIGGELIWEEKEQLYNKTSEILSKIKDNKDILSAIENWTIKTFEIPWSEKIAISLNWNNIDYVYNLDWTEYFDFQWRRSNWVRYSAYKWIMPDDYKENWENWIFYLMKWNVKIDPFSQDWLSSYLSIAEYMKGLVSWLNKVWKMDWDQVTKEEKN